MQTRNGIGIFLGVITILPIAYMIGFAAFWTWLAVSASAFDAWIDTLFVVHMVAVFTTVGMAGYYLLDLSHNGEVEESRKVAWAAAIILVGVIAMPLYWWRHKRSRG